MLHLIDFDINHSRLVGSVTVSKEHGLEGIVNAVNKFCIGALKLERLDREEEWRQVFYPYPVMHWIQQPDGSYHVEVYEAGK